MAALVTRDKLLGMTARRYDVIPTEIGDFRIRSLSEDEKSEFEMSVMKTDGDVSMNQVKRQRKRLIVQCVVNDAGEPMFTDNDLAALGRVDGRITHALYKACRLHVGLDENDIEELVGNSAGINVSSSPPISPSTTSGSQTSKPGSPASTPA